MGIELGTTTACTRGRQISFLRPTAVLLNRSRVLTAARARARGRSSQARARVFQEPPPGGSRAAPFLRERRLVQRQEHLPGLRRRRGHPLGGKLRRHNTTRHETRDKLGVDLVSSSCHPPPLSGVGWLPALPSRSGEAGKKLCYVDHACGFGAWPNRSLGAVYRCTLTVPKSRLFQSPPRV